MTVEQKRRELFEAWAITRRHPVNGLPFFVMKNDNGEYLDGTTTYAWEGFNAALEAVEIELPDELSACGDPWYMRELCKDAIESTGLGLKVKP